MKKQNENKPHIFGVRHFSPAGAYYVRKYLDEVQPKVVLIEAPSDFTDLIDKITAKEVVPPIAIMAYTLEAPIQTIIYPFAEFSPEYQAILLDILYLFFLLLSIFSSILKLVDSVLYLGLPYILEFLKLIFGIEFVDQVNSSHLVV